MHNDPKLRRDLREGEAQRPGSTWLWRWVAAGWLFFLPSVGLAQTNLPTTPLLLTNFTQIWAVTGEAAQRLQHIRAEAVISFYDADWTVAFGVCDGKFTYLPIATSKAPLKAGQRILLDGWVLPAQELFSWDKTQIKVLEENVPLAVTSVTSLRTNASQINLKLVSVEGLVKQDRMVDSNHLGLVVQVNGESATVNVHLHPANRAAAFTLGDLVRIKGLYVPTFDRGSNVSDMILWVNGPENVEKIGSIASEPRIVIPSLPPSAEQEETNQPTTLPLLTNFFQIWGQPGETAQQPQHIRAEAVISFYDAEWTVAFGVCDGKFTYLPIATSKAPLRAGQRILLDGWVIPSREVFLWDKTQVKVLQENVPLAVDSVTSLRTNASQIAGRMVSVEGLIDQASQVGSNHVGLIVLINGENTIVNIRLRTANQTAAFEPGDFVLIKGVYIPTYDRDGNVNVMSLWVDGVENVMKIGSLASDPRFRIPVTSTVQLGELGNTILARVAGVVRSHEAGKWVTLWDDTGEVRIQSTQTQPLRLGDRVEAIGYPYAIGIRNYLHTAIYRMADTNGTAPVSGATSNAPLFLAAQIQSLGPEEVKRHPPVKLRAILIWIDPAASFVYVQDASGCVRVVNPKFVDTNISDGTILNIRGEVTVGAYVPVVTNAVLSRAGWIDPEPPELINLDQALSGVAEGRYVEMRAFVRNAGMERGLTLLHLSTSQGEFQAWVPNGGPVASWVGSVVRIQGICSATSNDRHQLTGVELWVPKVDGVEIEEKAPDDLFASVFRSLGDLRRFSSQNYVNQRVRTAGTVVLQEPGRYLYLQDGADSIFALSQQKDLLKPGDRVEVVGFPGNEGRRFLLREANFRRVAKGVDPISVSLPDRHLVTLDLEGLLARSKGKLLDAVQKDGQARFLIQSAGYTFEARLNSPDTLERRQTQEPALEQQGGSDRRL